MNIGSSITARLIGPKLRRDLRQSNRLGGEFARKFKGSSAILTLHANDYFAAGFIRFHHPVRISDVLEAKDLGRLGFISARGSAIDDRLRCNATRQNQA